MRVAVIAHNIRSMHNVGSIFRAADCFGVEKLYLTGFTAVPPRKEITKVALGTEESVPWAHREEPISLIEELKGQGYLVASLELTENSVPIGTFQTEKPLALILGHEVDGVNDELLGASDVVLEIPIVGHKTSLNVSVATGVALYALTRDAVI